MVFFTRRVGTLFFVWNAILAFLPFLFSRLLKAHFEKPKQSGAVIFLLAFLWLIFFPNAPYMITDLIHVTGVPYYNYVGQEVVYNTSIYPWVMLIYIGGGAVFSMLMGLGSLHDIHTLLLGRLGRLAGNLILAFVFLASGFAIYVGRILRFNSWDVLRPFSLMTRIREDFNSFSVAFSLLFSAFIFGSYLVYYVLLPNAGKNARREGGASRLPASIEAEFPNT